jgi:hypothetical protein
MTLTFVSSIHGRPCSSKWMWGNAGAVFMLKLECYGTGCDVTSGSVGARGIPSDSHPRVRARRVARASARSSSSAGGLNSALRPPCENPEKTLLYQIVSQNLETFVEEVRVSYEKPLPGSTNTACWFDPS